MGCPFGRIASPQLGPVLTPVRQRAYEDLAEAQRGQLAYGGRQDEPDIQLLQPSGMTACDAVWMQEREHQEGSRALDSIQRAARSFGRDVHAQCRRPAARSSSQSTTRPGSGSSAPLVVFGRSGVGEGEVDEPGTRSRRSTLRALEVEDDGGREGDDGAGGSAGRAGSASGTDPASAFGFLGSGGTTVVAGFVSCGGGAGRAGSARVTGSESVLGLVGSGGRTVVAGFASCRVGAVSG
jgi:hypothetical protein